jgi:hypothetical protein
MRKAWDIEELLNQKSSYLVEERFFSKAFSKVQLPFSMCIRNQDNPVSAWPLPVRCLVISLIRGMDGEQVMPPLLQVVPPLVFTMFLMNYAKESVVTLLRPSPMPFG